MAVQYKVYFEGAAPPAPLLGTGTNLLINLIDQGTHYQGKLGNDLIKEIYIIYSKSSMDDFVLTGVEPTGATPQLTSLRFLSDSTPPVTAGDVAWSSSPGSISITFRRLEMSDMDRRIIWNFGDSMTPPVKLKVIARRQKDPE